MLKKSILPAAALTLLGGCASIPKPISGDIPISVPGAAAGLSVGTTVRWGGTIVSVQPRPQDTCFEVLAKELSASARPLEKDESSGRFIACRSGFFDPEVFVKGRELTVVGRLERVEKRKIGEYEYPFPILAADSIYLWPERIERDLRGYPAPFFGPIWWDPYPLYPRGFRTHGGPPIKSTQGADSKQQ